MLGLFLFFQVINAFYTNPKDVLIIADTDLVNTSYLSLKMSTELQKAVGDTRFALAVFSGNYSRLVSGFTVLSAD
jgi:hypothetical protein